MNLINHVFNFLPGLFQSVLYLAEKLVALLFGNAGDKAASFYQIVKPFMGCVTKLIIGGGKEVERIMSDERNLLFTHGGKNGIVREENFIIVHFKTSQFFLVSAQANLIP